MWRCIVYVDQVFVKERGQPRAEYKRAFDLKYRVNQSTDSCVSKSSWQLHRPRSVPLYPTSIVLFGRLFGVVLFMLFTLALFAPFVIAFGFWLRSNKVHRSDATLVHHSQVNGRRLDAIGLICCNKVLGDWSVLSGSETWVVYQCSVCSVPGDTPVRRCDGATDLSNHF